MPPFYEKGGICSEGVGTPASYSEAGATAEFIARQRLGEQVPAEMNTHATIEEIHCDMSVSCWGARQWLRNKALLGSVRSTTRDRIHAARR
jgi:hypothetical protein